MSATVFEHKGYQIEFLASGKFRATINGTVVVKTSLAAVKKVIDTPAPFEPFTGLVRSGREDGGVREVHIVGIRKKPGRRDFYGRRHSDFVTDTGELLDGVAVMENTPENRAAYLAVREFRAETDRIIAERRQRLYELEQAVKELNPDKM